MEDVDPKWTLSSRFGFRCSAPPVKLLEGRQPGTLRRACYGETTAKGQRRPNPFCNPRHERWPNSQSGDNLRLRRLPKALEILRVLRIRGGGAGVSPGCCFHLRKSPQTYAQLFCWICQGRVPDLGIVILTKPTRFPTFVGPFFLRKQGANE